MFVPDTDAIFSFQIVIL